MLFRNCANRQLRSQFNMKTSFIKILHIIKVEFFAQFSILDPRAFWQNVAIPKKAYFPLEIEKKTLLVIYTG